MTQLQVGLSQAFPFPGKLGLREAAAEREAEAAQADLSETRLRLIRDVKTLWWTLFDLDRALEIVKRNQDLLRQFVDVAQTKFMVGKGLQQDVLLAQVVRSKMLDREIALTGLRRVEQSRLNALLNLRADRPVALPTGGAVRHPQTELCRLVDLTRVWVYADLYEHELPWVQVGDEAEMSLAGIPGQAFRWRVTYIYPYAEAKTRTIKVRLEFDTEDLLLKPEMFANVTLQAAHTLAAVVVPASSVVRSGVREQVFVVRGPGKFEPRTVMPGVTSGLYSIYLGKLNKTH